jgi:hypothetical protein
MSGRGGDAGGLERGGFTLATAGKSSFWVLLSACQRWHADHHFGLASAGNTSTVAFNGSAFSSSRRRA